MRLQALLATSEELAGLGSWEHDLITGEVTWSDGMFRLVGQAPRDGAPTLERFLQHVHPADQDEVRVTLEGVIEHPEDPPDAATDLACRVVRSDGTVRDIRSLGRLEYDEDGLPVRWIGSAQDVTEQRLAERELHARYAVSQALRDWEHLEEGTVDLLRRLGTALDYSLGSLWIWSDRHGGLVCRSFWHLPGLDLDAFEAHKRSYVFPPGVGKPGRAWRDRRVVVTPDIVADPTFIPRDPAAERGLRSSLTFPAVGPEGPVAVLSFYAFDVRHPSASLVRTVTGIGRELGRFLHRRRGELEPARLSQRELEILRFAAEGASGPVIAERLVLSPSTIKSHFENLYEKLGVSDRAAAVALALREGLIQ